MKIEGRPTIQMEITMRLSEEEARALDALFGYEVEAFLTTFYEKLGRAYLEKHADGLRSLHMQRGGIGSWLRKVDEARKVFHGGQS